VLLWGAAMHVWLLRILVQLLDLPLHFFNLRPLFGDFFALGLDVLTQVPDNTRLPLMFRYGFNLVSFHGQKI